jgi:hypothetical protein
MRGAEVPDLGGELNRAEGGAAIPRPPRPEGLVEEAKGIAGESAQQSAPSASGLEAGIVGGTGVAEAGLTAAATAGSAKDVAAQPGAVAGEAGVAAGESVAPGLVTAARGAAADVGQAKGIKDEIGEKAKAIEDAKKAADDAAKEEDSADIEE